jgi:crossover junction endodeoxyribonuclease RuvC
VLSVADAGPVESRLALLHTGLSATLTRHHPEIVAIEDVFHARNARAAFVLGQSRGVALLAAAQSGAKVRSYAPTVIKQAVTGTGRAEKDQVARMVCALLGIDVAGRADATDALATALCGLLRAGDSVETPIARRHRDPRRSFERLVRRAR